jgi:hypothetical protein
MFFRKFLRKIPPFLLTFPVLFFIFFPILWLFSASLSNQVELYSIPTHWIPQHPTLQNYLDIIFPNLATSSVPRTFAVALLNSIKIASAVTVDCHRRFGSLCPCAHPIQIQPHYPAWRDCHAHDPGSIANSAAFHPRLTAAIDQ